MSPLAFPTAPVPAGLLSFSEQEAKDYAQDKHLTQWYWVKDAATLIEHAAADGGIHVEFVGMHWRKRKDRTEVVAAFEELREAGQVR